MAMHPIVPPTLALQEHAMHGMAHVPDPLSLFNHHLAGAFVILLGVLGYLDAIASSRRAWLKLLWPLPLLLLGVYLLLRSDAPDWPPNLARQLSETEGIQHKLFALLALTIGGIDLARRLGHLSGDVWKYVFSGALLLGGILLILHGGHHSRIVHQEHLGMGVIALSIAVFRVAADLHASARWIPVYLLPSLFTLLGLQLVLYVE